MNKNCPTILIIAPAGRLRDSLAVLLKSNHRVTLIGQAADCHTGLQATIKQCPNIVIIDTDLPDDCLQQLLSAIEEQTPHSQCLLLTHSSHQENRANFAGHNTICANNLTTKDLFQTIDRISESNSLSNTL